MRHHHDTRCSPEKEAPSPGAALGAFAWPVVLAATVLALGPAVQQEGIGDVDARLASAVDDTSGRQASRADGGQPAGGGDQSDRPAAPPDSTDPADAVLDRLLGPEGLPGRPETPLELQPPDVDPVRPGIAPDSPARLLREGSFVVDRIGRARSTPDGQGLEFVFDATGAAPGAMVDPPMILVPNLNLMALEAARRENPDRRFRITGRVTEYRGRNHLILEKVVVLR